MLAEMLKSKFVNKLFREVIDMEQKDVRFGDFIKSKRLILEITLRDMCERIGFSTAYLSDIENNRRYPMDNDKLELLIKELKITAEDQETLYDLAGKERKGAVSPDLPEYIMANAIVRVAIRKAKTSATDADWEEFIYKLTQKGNVQD